MNLRSIGAASVVVLAVVACATQEPATDTDGTWVGTITTEGNVTTVVNESGSVWEGDVHADAVFYRMTPPLLVAYNYGCGCILPTSTGKPLYVAQKK